MISPSPDEFIAALALALVSAFVAYYFGRLTEARAAHRLMLGPYLPTLSEELHRICALTVIMAEHFAQAEPHASYMNRAQESARALLRVRNGVRYTLWGTHNALGTLAKLPTWYSRIKDTGDIERFIRDADAFRDAIDGVVRRSYMHGRPPRRWEAYRLKLAEKRFKAHWETSLLRPEDSDVLEA